MRKEPKIDWENYEKSAPEVEDEKAMNAKLSNEKSRWSYKVPVCVKGLVGSDGAYCGNVGIKCHKCTMFSEYIEMKSK